MTDEFVRRVGHFSRLGQRRWIRCRSSSKAPNNDSDDAKKNMIFVILVKKCCLDLMSVKNIWKQSKI